ncbi:lysophospholipid acyltransferase family protein [Yoonia sp.]|uniref:lysophospholipid acyltransferase family protein n=1 Tax=Yoonia sp. TaxID=2212373 RepID=UPI0026007BC2|nr:lysophospholipid acyltransferase family protein [Yoonia sp.]
MTKPRGTITDRLTNAVFRGLIGGLKLLPYQTRVPLMGRVMRSVLGPVAGYKRRAENNLAMIYPEMPAPKRRQIAAACCDNFGRTLIENYSWRELGARMAKSEPTGAGLDHLVKAAAENRPVIFVTGHFGNHEAARHLLTNMGYDVGGFYRPMNNQFFNNHYVETMSAWGGPVFAKGKNGTIGFVRHLRDGGMGTIFFDVASREETIPFMGHPARTSLSPAKIALRLNALVIPYFAIRQPDGLSFQVEVEAPIAHSDPRDMMIKMNARLEAQIARNPSQWFWVHRRWK